MKYLKILRNAPAKINFLNMSWYEKCPNTDQKNLRIWILFMQYVHKGPYIYDIQYIRGSGGSGGRGGGGQVKNGQNSDGGG